MPQEQCTHQRHHDKFLDQLGRQIVDRTVDQFAAIVGRHNLHARRQTGLERFEFGFDGFNRRARILA